MKPSILDKYNALNGLFGGGGGGSSDYNALSNKPSINSVTLSGEKSAADLGLTPLYTSSSEVIGNHKMAYWKITSSTPSLTITLPSVGDTTASGTPIANYDIILDSTSVTSKDDLPEFSFRTTTADGVVDGLYVVDGNVPTLAPSSVTVIDCVTAPAMSGWVVMSVNTIKKYTE